jgi:hypothetical protein
MNYITTASRAKSGGKGIFRIWTEVLPLPDGNGTGSFSKSTNLRKQEYRQKEKDLILSLTSSLGKTG